MGDGFTFDLDLLADELPLEHVDGVGLAFLLHPEFGGGFVH